VKLGRIEVPAPAAGARTLILLHGFGADERDLLPLARELDPSFRVVSLAAPIAQGISFDPREVLEAGNIALEAIEDIARENPDPILCGFSQGGGMALAAVLERPGLVGTVLALSPVPPRREGDGKGLRVFLGHGTFDPLIPVQVAHATRDLLTKLRASVTYREYPMGHMICAEELEDARNFLAHRE